MLSLFIFLFLLCVHRNNFCLTFAVNYCSVASWLGYEL